MHNVLLCTNMPAWLLVLLTIGAVMRITRLVTADYITHPIRDRLIDRWGEDSKRSYLLTCDYCASIYLAPPITFAVVWWPTNRFIIIALISLAASFVAGFVAAHE